MTQFDEISFETKLFEIKAEGFHHGKDLVMYNIHDVELTEEMDLDEYKDAAITLAWEADEGSRQYSPFEFFAKELNDSEDPDAAWAAYEEGIGEGIVHEVDQIITDEYFENRQEKFA